MQPNVELINVMISFGGFAYSIVSVSTLVRSQEAAKRLGYTDDVPTYQLISGKLNCDFHILFVKQYLIHVETGLQTTVTLNITMPFKMET